MDRVVLRGWQNSNGPAELLRREWLITNGLGGYASGTLAGVATRRYHGVLIAALPAPLGRYVMLNHLEERIHHDGATLHLNGDERKSRGVRLPELALFREFRLEQGLPVWEFRNDRVHITKRLVMQHRRNTTWVTWHVGAASSPVRLTLGPLVNFRAHEQAVNTTILTDQYSASFHGATLEIRQGEQLPPLRLALNCETAFEEDARVTPELLYRVEKSRGYDHVGMLWNPGRLTIELAPGQTLRLCCTTDEIQPGGDPFEEEVARRESLLTQAGIHATDTLANLVFAADQFIILPTRNGEMLHPRAEGEEPRSVIAGYHWFTEWGRDTMISLEGLTLATGRTAEAISILRTFARHVRDGLIPNMFPEGENEGVYHTADATLWFFHALDRYLSATGNRRVLHDFLPTLDDIIARHVAGTRFGIAVDPHDGLLRQGAEGYQLTWMDAKVDAWVVTPRRGKAVEINALFYNAVRLLEEWTRDSGNAKRAEELGALASQTRASFNQRFWFERGGYLYDVVDTEDGGDDSALRPNQIFSISLRHAVLDRHRWRRVIDVVERDLLTPYGLRSLAPSHRDYKQHYVGDLRTRDASYHQGTVWSWLIGPFVDACLKTEPANLERARTLLRALERHLEEAGIGSVSELFDAEAPHEPGGCIAQAWGVAELLRCLRLVRATSDREELR
ncbi:MAG TPA: amylo-alpha-1,6-glucosidase [Thermoanaerobaculia bacterium]|nr:amylo-alpha-1,6-glucosidase [Thermoanaerobaculia bacterium]